MSWSAEQYKVFEAERTRPVRDLLAAVRKRDVRFAVDLGCGPGNSTEVLVARFPEAKIMGLDSSGEMIAAAQTRLPRVAFKTGYIETWEVAEKVDLILANASLQWVPDHAALLPKFIDTLATGGVLAVQVPDNWEEPGHRLMREIAANGKWAGKLASVKRTARQSAGWYYDLLKPLCASLDIWRTIYLHPLSGGAAAIVEWFKGSSLRPYLEALDDAERSEFLTQYQAAVGEAYPPQADGTILLPYPRLFVMAQK